MSMEETATNKNVRFSDETETEQQQSNTRFKEKHSLDSDEEDDNQKYDVLAEDDIEGQEEATIAFDEEIQITPFNMREEMEEGHFDKDGTYIFDKSKEIHDNWIDNIDWVKVQHKKETDEEQKKRPFEFSDDSDDSSDDDVKTKKSKTDKQIALYDEMMTILQDGETPSKAIRRLAKNKSKIPSASQRWKNKKLKASGKVSEEEEKLIEQAKEEQKVMLRLTEICDSLVQRGLIDIYETSYEKINFTLKQLKEKDKASRLTIAEGTNADDALDMFADDFDSKQTEQKQTTTKSTESNSENDKTKESEGLEVNAVMWEYREKNEDDSPLKGPYTTSQMMTMLDDGQFGNGVFCRKVGTDGQFYNSSRIDFDLYM